MNTSKNESPDYLQTSTAGAMALGFEKGTFFRGAVLHCLNLLLTYSDGCRANCAFCGLGRERSHDGTNQDKTFIRVRWLSYPVDAIVKALSSPSCNDVRRACVSMVTHPRAMDDTLAAVQRIKPAGKDISVLIAPSVIDKPWLEELHGMDVDKIDVAIDASTTTLFDKLRGTGVNGPHSWERYWDTLRDAIDVFGAVNTGIHLMIGLGETEEDAIAIIQWIHSIGSDTHLFSFFPEPGSLLEHAPQPGIGKYRRIQLAREAIHRDLTAMDSITFNDKHQITDFGMSKDQLNALVEDGTAFLTQGCKDKLGFITCNRPYSNSTPFQAAKGELRNFPFPPDSRDIALIHQQLQNFDDDAWIRPLDTAEDFLLDETP